MVLVFSFILFFFFPFISIFAISGTVSGVFVLVLCFEEFLVRLFEIFSIR